MKQILGFIKWFVVLAIILGLAFLVYAGIKITRPFKTGAEEKVFSIESGSTTEMVAASLEADGIVDKAFFFKLYLYLQKSGHKIQAGNYLLSASMPVTAIAKKLIIGEVVQNEIRFTVIEGWSADDIAAALQIQGLARARDFLRVDPSDLGEEYSYLQEIPRNYSSLEGYLFPDTYAIAKDATPVQIAGKMVANFDRKLGPELREKIASQSKTIRQIIILASIVEREVGRNVKKGTKLGKTELERLQQERKMVSSVFWNRIGIGKALESDATISYITGRKDSASATLEETRINSPYNTYRNVGLPPGPISNPSLDSIVAAIEPAVTDYLYFLTAPDGTAYFAETLDGHIENRNKYLAP
ncbi:MAG: endolytic transglycosylase MltG [bacterium]|nr:endolytic transglycosylase MltG [bacterium]